MSDALEVAVLVLTIGIAAYSVMINLSFLVLTGFAMGDLAGYRRRLEYAGYDQWFLDPNSRGVSVLMPAHNESATIVQSVQAMISLRYPDFEVVVIDDGSTDDTREKLIREFDMAPVPLVPSGDIELEGVVEQTYVSRRGAHNLALVAKTNGGKADALNAGINYSRKELVCMVDADSLLDPQALLNVARPFADNPGRVVAAGGVVRVANGSRVERGRVTSLRMPGRLLARIAVVEYLRAFLIGRAGWSRLGGLLIISGAFGIFRKDVLQAVGGMSVNSIGEDAELVVRIHRMLGDLEQEGDVVFVPEPVAWTEVPETRAVLRKQRRRWHRGLAEIFLRHRSMLFRPRYGVIGMVTMPWFLFFELLAPAVEVFGLLWFLFLLLLLLTENWYPQLDLVNPEVVVLLLAASVLFAVFVTLVALLAEELSFRRYRGLRDLFRAVWAAVEENLGYRQLNAFWRLGGLVEALRGTRHDWGEMTRKGFDE
ncbi:glycosyltransferase family 2 protein [Nocardioides euryhalodurans]|nr:glycosyltransferase [Nocardioides euryhalodurans]